MYANYHTHTYRCKHAIGEDKEYVEAAIRGGMQVLGFSDHCPWNLENGYVSQSRMELSQLDNYVNSIESLKKEYKNDITIYLGFECEYIPELMHQQEELFKGYPIDYLILGQHFLTPEPYGAYTGIENNDETFFMEYIDSTIEAMETGKYRYLAHPDLIHFTKNQELYDTQMLRLLTFLKENNIPVEINLLGVYEQRHYTSRHFLELAKKVGNSVIVGVDAHQPERLEMIAAQEQCYQMAMNAGLDVVTVLEGLDK